MDLPRPAVLGPTLKIINGLVSSGLIANYAIGGSMSIIFYSEPFDTRDLDIFCYLPQEALLFQLGPIWQHLESLGCRADGLYMIVEGVPIQFLPPPGPLECEALDTAISVLVEGVPTRIFQLEYAMAIKVQVGRAKDWNHIEIALNSADPNIHKLEKILLRFGLLSKWRQYLDGRQ